MIKNYFFVDNNFSYPIYTALCESMGGKYKCMNFEIYGPFQDVNIQLETFSNSCDIWKKQESLGQKYRKIGEM